MLGFVLCLGIWWPIVVALSPCHLGVHAVGKRKMYGGVTMASLLTPSASEDLPPTSTLVSCPILPID